MLKIKNIYMELLMPSEYSNYIVFIGKIRMRIYNYDETAKIWHIFIYMNI